MNSELRPILSGRAKLPAAGLVVVSPEKWQLIGWYAACQCGEWRSHGVNTRKLAEEFAVEEREWIFRPLNTAVEHSTSAQEGAS